jgi:ER degradation enhancer, mannosidase alpha-like 2
LEEAINKHVRKEDWFMWVDKDKATVSLPIFQSLEAFWPGLLVPILHLPLTFPVRTPWQTLVGKVEDAARIMGSYAQIIRHVGLAPEFYNLPNREPVHRRAAYPLRPEVPESLMYLYRATKDPAYLHVAASIVDVSSQSFLKSILINSFPLSPIRQSIK